MSDEVIAVANNPMQRVLHQRDFVLLWSGQGTSLLGDQFYMVAAPWLVLQLTGDPLALGTVLAIGAIPRAVMMLIGGAISDRFSPRKIMLASDLVRLVLTIAMLVLVITGQIQVWMLYVLSALFGTVSGFFIPAANSIIPDLLSKEDLQAGNSIFQGSSQLVSFIGPALAGLVVGSFAGELKGISLALGVDAVTFVISVATLWFMKPGVISLAQKSSENVWEAIKTGIRFAWGDTSLKLGFILIAFANLFFAGPVLIGIPVLADQRLVEGATAYGLIMSAFAGGGFLGIVLCGALPPLSIRSLKYGLVAFFVLFGLGLIGLGLISATWMGCVLMFLLGTGNGYLSIVLITGIQRRTPKELMGRLMSLVLLANLGLAPISQTAAGALSRWSVTGLLAISGLSMLILSGWLVFQPQLEQMAVNFSIPPKQPVPVNPPVIETGSD